jgi:hypothetical protein
MRGPQSLECGRAGVSHPRTPVGYFPQDETGSTPRPVTLAGTRDCRTPNRGGLLTLGGHRLPSLYRGLDLPRRGLRKSYQSLSSWQKYPAGGAGGAKPPAVVAPPQSGEAHD